MAGRNLFAEPRGRNLFAEEAANPPAVAAAGMAGGSAPVGDTSGVFVPPTEQKMTPHTGNILPFSSGEDGIMHFDPNAGIVGPFYRALQLPEDLMTGKIDPRTKEGTGRMFEAMMLASPVSAAARAAPAGPLSRALVGGYRSKAPAAPSREALRDAAKAAYDAVDNLDVAYSGGAIKSFADDAQRMLNEEGFIAELAPQVHALLGKLQSPPSGATASLRSLDAFRKRLGDIAGTGDDTTKAAASKIIQAVDEFVEKAGSPSAMAGTVARGPADQAAKLLGEARGNAAAGFRSDRITGLEETAGLRAKAANSGMNADNTIRQRLTSLLQSKNGTRGFSDEEVTAIRDIIEGRPTKNAARFLGNLLGGGGGLGMAVTSGMMGVGGASAAGPMGAAAGALPPIVGALMKKTANRMTRNELAAVDDMIRARSPLGQNQKPTVTFQPEMVKGRLARALLAAPAQRAAPTPQQWRDWVARGGI